METKLEQIAAKAVKQQPKSVVREIRTPRSVGTGGRRLPPVTRCGQQWPSLPESNFGAKSEGKLPAPYSLGRRPEPARKGRVSGTPLPSGREAAACQFRISRR